MLTSIKQRTVKAVDFMKLKLKKTLASLKISPDFRAEYRSELNRLAKKYFLVPTLVIVLFSWLFYIKLDALIYPKIPILVYLRIGLSVTGILAVILFFCCSFKNKSYVLLLSLAIYFEVSSGLIAGLVTANHAYMSGFLMIIITLAIVPLERLHSGIILAAALAAFFLTGFLNKMNFASPEDRYLLYNIIATFSVAIAAIIVLDIFRRKSLENYIATQEITRRIFDKNDELEKAHLDLEKANREQIIANKKLQEANELKGKFLNMAAHDLKNPLQVILLYAHSLADYAAGKTDESGMKRVAKAAEIIGINAEKMDTLIKQTLEAAVIDSGKLILSQNSLDLGELAGFVVKTFMPSAIRKKQEIHFQAAKECFVNGDNVRLGQVMENLLSNAVKFSSSGCSIWVTVERDEEAVTFKVRDEGPGLNEEDKKNLFKEFRPLTPKPTGGETSTGLGLSIVRTLVKLHNGNIRVESEPGQGSAFIVELPLCKTGVSAAALDSLERKC
jgi:signal transduction histidine kinase